MRPAATNTFFASTLLPQICRYVPHGLEKAILFYSTGENNTLVAAYTDKTIISHTVDLPSSKITATIRRLRAKSLQWEWFANHELDFEKDSYRPAESTLFTPLHESVLLLRLPTTTVGISDLLFLFFNKNISYLKPLAGNEDEHFLKQTKDSIGSLLSGIFNQMYTEEDQSKQEFNRLMKLMDGAFLEVENLSHQLSQERVLQQERIFRYCIYRLKALSSEKARSISFHDSARQKLLSYNGEIEDLDNIISNAVFFAENVNNDPFSQLVIKGHQIQFRHHESVKKDTKRIPTQRSSEARSYLDRLEKAASEVQSSEPSRKLTGTLLGSYMRPEVSASAISQWLTKYGAQMRELLVNYPSDWRIIRNNFQPIKRKLLDSSEAIQKTGT